MERQVGMEKQTGTMGSTGKLLTVLGIGAGVVVILALAALVAMMFGVDVGIDLQ
jgi:hypothetical protein